MADLIDREEVLKVLQELKKKKENCNCSRQVLREAQAIGYAIAIIKQVKAYENQ